LAGGYTRSVNTYSQGASSVVFPHVLGLSVADLLSQSTDWRSIAQHTTLFVAFGGVPPKNADVCAGGTGQHLVAGQLSAAQASGTRFVLISPQRSDLPDWLNVDWFAIEPGTDTALMLALAHVLDAEGFVDQAFLKLYCVGANEWLAYVRGMGDGIAKTPDWAGLDHRHSARANRDPRSRYGLAPNVPDDLLVVATKLVWRTAGLGLDRSGRAAWADRRARGWRRPWLRDDRIDRSTIRRKNAHA
jgi:biotin/methionine sulfoxide reductase